MSTQNWTTTKEEKTELNGEIVTRKVVLEPTKNFLGVSVDTIDLLIKISGIVLIFIAVFDYLDKVEAKNQEEIRQHYSDSVSTARYREQQFNYSKEQQRLDTQLAAQQQEIANNQLNFQKELDFKRQELEKRLANSFEQIYLQREGEIARERRGYYSSSLTNSSSRMEILLNKSPSSEIYSKAKEELLFDSYPQIGNIGDTRLLNMFIEFKSTLAVYELLQQLAPISDTMFKNCFAISQKIKKDTGALRVAFYNNWKDSLIYYESQEYRIGRYSAQLWLKAREIEAAAKSVSGETKAQALRAAKILNDSIANGYGDYASLISTFCTILSHKYSQSQSYTEQAFKVFAEGLIYARSVWDAHWAESINFNKIKDSMFLKLQNLKSEYDAMVHEKLSFYNEKK